MLRIAAVQVGERIVRMRDVVRLSRGVSHRPFRKGDGSWASVFESFDTRALNLLPDEASG